MRKFLYVLLASILLLAACSSGSKKEGEVNETANDNEITVWAWDPNFNIAALKLAEEVYDGDVKLKIVDNAQDDIVQKLNTTLSSGTTKGLPNIVLIEDYRAQSFLQAYPDSFFDISQYFNEEDFAEYKRAPTSVDGKNYGLPFDTGVTGLFVRTDYLEEAGYTVADLTDIDWNQYIEIGKVVKEKTGKDFLSLDPNDLGIIRFMTQTAGAWYLKEDGKTPDIEGNEALKEAFKVYKRMLDENVAKPHSDWSQFIANFNSGDVVTVATGNWITPTVKSEESQAGKWAVVPTPKLPIAGAVNASNLGGSSWYVLDVPGKEKAAEFLGKTFGSNKEFYEKLITDVGALGTYLPAADSDAYTVEDPFFNGQAVAADFAKWMDEIIGVNFGMHTYAIEDILIVGMQDYLNGKDIDAVMKDAQQQAESQIK